MIPHLGVTLQTMDNIDPSDTRILSDMIKDIKGSTFDRQIDSRYTNREALADSKETGEIVTTSHALLVVFASEMDIHVGAKNIHKPTLVYATCHVFNVKALNIRLQIANVLRHLNKSRRAQ